MSFVRTQIEVTTAGTVQLRLGNVAGLHLWVDGNPVPLQEVTLLKLETGVHNLTFRGRRRSQGCAEAGVEDAPDSPAQRDS